MNDTHDVCVFNRSFPLLVTLVTLGLLVALDSRQNGGQREELGGQVGQVDQQEDEERLDDANLLREARDEAEDDGEHQTHQSPSDTDNEEGGWGGGAGGGRGGDKGAGEEGGKGGGEGEEGGAGEEEKER